MSHTDIHVPSQFIIGTNFLLLGTSKVLFKHKKLFPMVVSLKIDPNGHILYWISKHHTTHNFIFIQDIVDIRMGKQIDKIHVNREEIMNNLHLMMTIVSNVDFTHPQFTTFIYVENQPNSDFSKNTLNDRVLIGLMLSLSKPRENHLRSIFHEVDPRLNDELYPPISRKGMDRMLENLGCSQVKQIADVVKRFRKAIMNFLRHQEEYGTKKSSGRPGKMNGHEKRKFCGLRRITRSASLEPVGLVAFMPQKVRCGESCTSVPNIVQSRMKKCLQVTQRHNGERLLGQNIHEMQLGKECLRTSSSLVSPTFSKRYLHFPMPPFMPVKARKRLKSNEVDTPDLDLMENLWVILVWRIKDLKSAINKSWSEVDKGVVNHLVINKSGSCTEN
uniref:PH_14 domain-containing protein n=1 Tax=Heterorhabditis bacteriophora TaxID=37862 RepID=A0A1I7X313_HETBA